jgi:hypothetical protein
MMRALVTTLLVLAACEPSASAPDAGVTIRDLAPASEARLDRAPPDGGAAAQRCGTCHLGPAAEIKTGLHSHFPKGCLECHGNGLAHQDAPATVEAELDLSVERLRGLPRRLRSGLPQGRWDQGGELRWLAQGLEALSLPEVPAPARGP